EAKLYTGTDRDELNMVFHFEHVDVGNGSFGKWNPTDWKLTDLKTIFSRWQEGLEEDGWNSLYWSNHDQPRAISRFGNDSDEYRVVSGKMLATLLHMLKGTPYIYQGEEFGMTNVAFDSIDEYRDIETLNAYRDYTTNGLLTHDEIFRGIHARGRDNSRTPVQWSAEAQGGFTSGTPWIGVNPNYVTVNAEAARRDPDSLFHYYRQLIQLRKQHPIVVYGKYELLLPDDEAVYAFTRTFEGETWLVLCNFSAETVTRELPYDVTERVIGNMEPIEPFTLRPYEAQVYKV
ncbi:MAG: alpha-amylase family glycosyl hydrolase, partial [Exiguobacterium chiriqhucha]